MVGAELGGCVRDTVGIGDVGCSVGVLVGIDDGDVVGDDVGGEIVGPVLGSGDERKVGTNDGNGVGTDGFMNRLTFLQKSFIVFPLL